MRSFTGFAHHEPDEGFGCPKVAGVTNARLDLLSVTASGSSTLLTLMTGDNQSGDGWPDTLTPLPSGGVLVSGYGTAWIVSGGTQTAVAAPDDVPVMVGFDGTVFPSRLNAFDLLTGTTYWQGTVGGRFGLAALPNRGALYGSELGGVFQYNGSGVCTTGQLPLFSVMYWGDGRYYGTTFDGKFAEAIGNAVDDDTFFRPGDNKPVECTCLVLLPPVLTEPVFLYVLPNTFLPEELTIFRNAAKEWETALRALRPSLSISVVIERPRSTAKSVEVSIDTTTLFPGLVTRPLGGQWTMKFNPTLYPESAPRYLRLSCATRSVTSSVWTTSGASNSVRHGFTGPWRVLPRSG